MQDIKNWLKRSKYILIVIILMAAAGVYASINNNEQTNNESAIENTPKKIETIVLDVNATNNDEIKTVGTVKAEASVDIVAMTGGTVKSLTFAIGDEVSQNQVLATLKNDQTATNYANANTGVSNALSSLAQTRRIADEGIRQAELGVQNSLQSVQSAEIALQSAKDNLVNVGALKDKSKADVINQAKISFYTFLNAANTALEQVDFIIDAEENGLQLDGIAATLGVKDQSSVSKALNNYKAAKSSYDAISTIQTNDDTIENDMKKAITLLSMVKTAVDNTISVLDNTVTYAGFSESTLNAQKSAFNGLRANLVGSQNTAESTLQTLENVDLSNKQEINALENAVKAAESQLELARVGHQNALASLDAAEQAKAQQLIASQSALDSASGQKNLVGSLISDLNIKSPIAGKITSKLVEVGTQVSPGQAIANVSRTERVKIEISLPSEDVYRVKTGQIVSLGDNLVGNITSIDPAADPITRQVKIEILFDNKNNELIVGTFIDVSIPVEKLEKTHEESFFIPLKALSITQTQSFVYIVQENKAKQIPVVTGRTEGALIEILDGLNNGDELVINGAKILNEGDLITTE